MKRSLLTVITFALVLVNLVLTAVLTIAIIPEVQNANALIAKVTEAIDLDLESGDAASTGSYDQADITNVAFSDTLTIALKKGDDGEQHYAVLGIVLSVYNNSENYETYGATITGGDNESYLQSVVTETVSQFTLDEIEEDPDAVKDAILQQYQNLYGRDLIVDVSFSSATYQ